MSELAFGNLLLAHMDEHDRDLLAPMERVELAEGDMLESPRNRIEHIYFPITAVASVAGSQLPCLDIDLIGREGMTGLPLVLDELSGMGKTYVLLPGQALRISSRDFRQAMTRSASLRAFLQRYVLASVARLRSIAFVHGKATLAQRLGHWLLMCTDRYPEGPIRLSHNALGSIVGARRASVTEALHTLEDRHLVKSERMYLHVIDRRRLIAFTQGYYGIAEDEYLRLMGFPLRFQPGDIS